MSTVFYFILAKEEAKKLASDAMYKLEHNAEDVKKGKAAEGTIDRLIKFKRNRMDDFTANQLLRSNLRVQ